MPKNQVPFSWREAAATVVLSLLAALQCWLLSIVLGVAK